MGLNSAHTFFVFERFQNSGRFFFFFLEKKNTTIVLLLSFWYVNSRCFSSMWAIQRQTSAMQIATVAAGWNTVCGKLQALSSNLALRQLKSLVAEISRQRKKKQVFSEQPSCLLHAFYVSNVNRFQCMNASKLSVRAVWGARELESRGFQLVTCPSPAPYLYLASDEPLMSTLGNMSKF